MTRWCSKDWRREPSCALSRHGLPKATFRQLRDLLPLKAIGEDGRTGSNVLCEEVVDPRRLEVGDDAHANAAGDGRREGTNSSLLRCLAILIAVPNIAVLGGFLDLATSQQHEV